MYKSRIKGEEFHCLLDFFSLWDLWVVSTIQDFVPDDSSLPVYNNLSIRKRAFNFFFFFFLAVC